MSAVAIGALVAVLVSRELARPHLAGRRRLARRLDVTIVVLGVVVAAVFALRVLDLLTAAT